jgi:hypothetical protein
LLFIHHKEWVIAIQVMSLLLLSTGSSCIIIVIINLRVLLLLASTSTTTTTASTTLSTMGTSFHQCCLTVSSWRLHANVLDAWFISYQHVSISCINYIMIHYHQQRQQQQQQHNVDHRWWWNNFMSIKTEPQRHTSFDMLLVIGNADNLLENVESS